MTIIYANEKERMRATNLQLLRAILEADTLSEEPQTPFTNFRSQMDLRAFLRSLTSLYETAFSDIEIENQETSIKKIRVSIARERFNDVTENQYNFISARRILIHLLPELALEQKYDLRKLMVFDASSIHEDNLYKMSKSEYLIEVEGHISFTKELHTSRTLRGT